MYYTIYQTTNLLNNKIYIGKHQTFDLDDDYFGSGKYLSYAIEKYGEENFKKDILFVFTSEQEMNDKEKEIVSEEFLSRDDVYNLCPGGKGGFGYLNNHPEKLKWVSNAHKNVKNKDGLSKGGQHGGKSNVENKTGLFNPKYDKEIRRKWSKLSSGTKGKTWKKKSGIPNGEKNSQFGTMWITNGSENKKIKKEDKIPNGFYKGRICKSKMHL